MSWSPRSLDELGTVGRGKSRHRPRDAEHLYGGAYPFIQTGDIKHANLYITEYNQIYSEAGLAQSKLWNAGTLCITIAANIADTAILGFDACFPDSVIGFVADPQKADTRFIKYLFDSQLQRRFQQFTQGAAQDNLSETKLLSLRFLVPDDVAEQTDIANILSSYDMLIENNRCRIALLEQAVRLLYKEWFVRLRFPGHEHVKVVDGVPEGWENVTLNQLAEVNRLSLGENYEGEIEYLDISGVSEGTIGGLVRYDFKLAPSRARRVVTHGDIIWSCVRPNRRSHAIIFNPSGNMIVSTGFAVITPRTVPTSFLYQAVTTPEFVSYLSNNARGAAYPAVTASDFKKAMLLLPGSFLVRQFDDMVAPMVGLCNVLKRQNGRLAQARDLILPRLMNGEIAV